MDEKLVALAMIRASITNDLDALQVILAKHPPTPGLVASLVTLTAGILEHGCGRGRAIEAVDGWAMGLMGATRARDEG